MITDEQVKLAVNTYFNAPPWNSPPSKVIKDMRKALETYEQSKWVKFDEYDEATYPEKDREVMLDVGYGLITGWFCIEESPFSHNPDDYYNTLWVCLDGRYEITEISSVSRWQPLPEFKG